VIVSIDLADTKSFTDAAAGSQIKIILLNVNSERCEHLLLGFLLKVVTAKVQQHFTRKSAARQTEILRRLIFSGARVAS